MNPYVSIEGWLILPPNEKKPDSISLRFLYVKDNLPSADEIFANLSLNQLKDLIAQLQHNVDVIEHGEKVPADVQTH